MARCPGMWSAEGGGNPKPRFPCPCLQNARLICGGGNTTQQQLGLVGPLLAVEVERSHLCGSAICCCVHVPPI